MGVRVKGWGTQTGCEGEGVRGAYTYILSVTVQQNLEVRVGCG